MIAPRQVVVGTAGHIDHGKSLLVEALTGTNPDRLKEERERGITIDIGFANLVLDDGTRVGFVDVPGHERFVKNMLAGVGGIDLVLLVIAADESIKPQTREHFDICRLLRIRHGIIVLSKSDLVDSDILDLVRLEAREFVAGSFLASAPIIAASSRTGAGLADLRAAIQDLAALVPQRPALGLPGSDAPLKDMSRVRFHHGTLEAMARVKLLEGAATSPGGGGYAQLRLETPVTALPGDRFILRRYSPPITIGGGTVLHNRPPKLRRSTPGARERFERLADPSPAIRVGALVREAGASGIDAHGLRSLTGLDPLENARL